MCLLGNNGSLPPSWLLDAIVVVEGPLDSLLDWLMSGQRVHCRRKGDSAQ